MQEQLGSIKSFMQTSSVPLPSGLHGINAIVCVFDQLPN